MKYDELLQQIGEFGKYQKCVFFTVCTIQIIGACNFVGIIFISGVPEHWCNVRGLSHLGLAEDAMKNLTIPTEEKDGVERYSQCAMYDMDYEDFNGTNITAYLQNRNNTALNTIACNDGWVYDYSLYGSTIVTQWDLVCNRSWLISTATSVYMLGLMIGVIFFGAVSDWIGRRKTLLLTIPLDSIFVVAQAFAPNIKVFLALRFMIGLCTLSAITTAFVIAIELVGQSYRVMAGMIFNGAWALTYLAVTGIAYFVRDWATFALVLSVSSFICYVCYFVVPESVRWLYIRGRREEADQLLRRAAKVNGKYLPEVFEVEIQADQKRATIIDLVRTPRMRAMSLNLSFNWFVNCLVYFGLSLNTSNLGGNPYVNSAISAAVEIPSYIIIIFLIPRAGRRIPLCLFLLIGGAALLLTGIVPYRLNIIAIVLAMIGKFFISASFGLIYLYTAELFPTSVRNVGLGTASFSARIGAIVAPYFAQLSDVSKLIPLLTFGSMSLAAGALALLLPETKGKYMSETIEESEHFDRKPATKIIKGSHSGPKTHTPV